MFFLHPLMRRNPKKHEKYKKTPAALFPGRGISVNRMLIKPMQFEVAQNRSLIINDLQMHKVANLSFSEAC